MTDFNISKYKEFLQLAKKLNYVAKLPEELPDLTNRNLILRHDVDFDIFPCLQIANLDAEYGFFSHFFFLVDSNFYSIHSPKNLEIISEISRLGHQIGLHWDRKKLPLDNDVALRSLKLRKDMLAEVVGREIKYASQHMPTSSDPLLGVETVFQVELYSSFNMKNYYYISDSSMKWRTKSVFDVLIEEEAVHFLAHPLWWVNEGVTARDKLDVSRNRLFKEIAANYADFSTIMEHVLRNRVEIDKNISPRIFKSN